MRLSAAVDAVKDSSLRRNKVAVERVLRSHDSSDEDETSKVVKNSLSAITPGQVTVAEQGQRASTDHNLRRRQMLFDSDDEEPQSKGSVRSSSTSEISETLSKTTPQGQKPTVSKASGRPGTTPKLSKLAKLWGDDGDDEEGPRPNEKILNLKPSELKDTIDVGLHDHTGEIAQSKQKDGTHESKTSVPIRSIQAAPTHHTKNESSNVLEETRIKKQSELAPTTEDRLSKTRTTDPPKDQDSAWSQMIEASFGTPVQANTHNKAQRDPGIKDVEQQLAKQIETLPSQDNRSHPRMLASQDTPSKADAAKSQDNSHSKIVDAGRALPQQESNRTKLLPDGNYTSKALEPTISPKQDLSRLKKPDILHSRQPKEEDRRAVNDSHDNLDEAKRSKLSDSYRHEKPPLSGKNLAKPDATGEKFSSARTSTPLRSPKPSAGVQEHRTGGRGKAASYSRKDAKYSDSDSDDLDEIAGRRARAAILSSSPITSRGVTPMRQSRTPSSIPAKSSDGKADTGGLPDEVSSLQNEVKDLRRQLATQSESSQRQIQALEKALAKAKDDERYFKSSIDDLSGQLRRMGVAPRLPYLVANEQNPSANANGHLQTAGMIVSADVVLDQGERIKSLDAQAGRVWEEDIKRSEPDASYRRVEVIDTKAVPKISSFSTGQHAAAAENGFGSEFKHAPSNDKYELSEALVQPKSEAINEYSTRSKGLEIQNQPLRNTLDLLISDNSGYGLESSPIEKYNLQQNDASVRAKNQEQDQPRHVAPAIAMQQGPDRLSETERAGTAIAAKERQDLLPSGPKPSSTADVEISLGSIRQSSSPSTQGNPSDQVLSESGATPQSSNHGQAPSLTDQQRASQTASLTSSRPSSVGTPTRKPLLLKSVSVMRQPLKGAQPVSAHERIGIGISFGVTAKGDVFITGMAAEGPAQLCGQIRNGDQLLAVDGINIRGWDVHDIVKSIIGPNGTAVTLDLASNTAKLVSPESSPAR